MSRRNRTLFLLMSPVVAKYKDGGTDEASSFTCSAGL